MKATDIKLPYMHAFKTCWLMCNNCYDVALRKKAYHWDWEHGTHGGITIREYATCQEKTSSHSCRDEVKKRQKYHVVVSINTSDVLVGDHHSNSGQDVHHNTNNDGGIHDSSWLISKEENQLAS